MPIETTKLAYSPTLTQAGLDEEQAAIYEVLLKEGALPARKIHQKTPYKRGLVYKKLEELQELGLVVRKDAKEMVSIFEPQHPSKLKELAERRVEKAKSAENALSGVIDDLVSDFNLISGKPGVRVYEGMEGAMKILNDSLTSKTEIYSYIDNEAVDKLYPKINDQYVNKRNKNKIKKKMIMTDSEYTRKHEKGSDPETTEIRLVAAKTAFVTVMQIYDNKVSYISISDNPNKLISIIIEQSNIAQMHKSLFEIMWDNAKPLPGPEPRPRSRPSGTKLV